METDFKKLTDSAFDFFDTNPIKISKFKGKIANSMDVSLRANIFDHLKACCGDLKSDSLVVDAWLDLSSLWDFLNYELLELVIQTFIPDDNVKLDLQRYVGAIYQFCLKTKVHEFFQAWPFRMKNQKPKEANVRKIVAKTDYSWEQCTLQDVKETTNFIAQLLSISRPFLPVRNVEEGCVSIHWYIPSSVAAHVETLEVQPDSMTKHRLLSIAIDSVQIYSLAPATRKVSLRLKEFYKSKLLTTKLDLMQPFKLALIKKEIYEDDVFTLQSLRGDKDDVLFKKSPTTLSTLGYLPDGSPARLVLIEGAAGVGKTTFTLNACIKWANNDLLNHITMLFLLPSRDSNVQSIKNLDNLVALIAPRDKSLQDELKTNDGGGAVFWLEGWDEIPSRLDEQSSFFEKLVSREILANAVVIVSSRPWATHFIKEQLNKQPSQHIEIVASVYDQIVWLIELKEKSSPKQSDLLNAFLKYLDETPAIKGNMHTPLATNITLTVYQWCRESSIDLPTTVTQLYQAYACWCVHKSLETDLELDPKVWKSNNFNDLIEPYKTWLFSLCQLALNGLKNRQQLVFTDVPNVLGVQTLGLMQAVSPLYVSEGSSLVSYHFNHLTLQEFLAAISLSRLSDEERSEIIDKCVHDGFFTNVMRFFSGETKSSFVLRDHMTRMLCTEEGGDKLIVFHWLFEGDYKASIADIIGDSEMSIYMDDNSSALDYFVTGYCIARSNCVWNINFCHRSVTDAKIIQFFQALIHCPVGEQGNPHITSLDMSLNYLTSHSIRYLPDIPRHFLHHLKILDLSQNKLDSTAVDHIAKIIPHTPQLENLYLWRNKYVKSGGAVSLISTLVDHKALKILSLSGINFGEEDCKQLACLLSSNQSLEELDVSFNNLSSDSLHILFRGLRQSKIKILDLSSNMFGDSESIDLGQILAENNTITKLDLIHCSISTIGGAALASSLMTNSTLEYLDIRRNSLRGEAAQKFAELLQHNKTLRTLNMDGDSSLTQSDIKTLIDSLSNNTTLEKLILPNKHKQKVYNIDKSVMWYPIFF